MFGVGFDRFVLWLTRRSFVEILIQIGWSFVKCYNKDLKKKKEEEIILICMCFVAMVIIREFVEEANKASMRINEYLHVRWLAIYLFPDKS